MKAIGQPILEAPKANGGAEVVGVNYDLYNLTIGLSDEEKNSILVVFQGPVGFRVMEEGDLLEYWPSCSSPNGWAFRIVEGGWLEQEKEREGFLAGQTKKGMKEYLFAGVSECVSVLSEDEPHFIHT